MKKLEKVIRLGRGYCGDVFCKIKIEEGKLSISGVEGPLKNGDCKGSCGQIDMHLKAEDITELAPGWTVEKVREFLEVWDKWHLNDMRAGCVHQRALGWVPAGYGKENPMELDCDTCTPAQRLHLDRITKSGNFKHEGKVLEWRVQWYDGALKEKRGFRTERGADQFAAELPQSQSPYYCAAVVRWPDCVTVPCPECGYRYGVQWLREELPASVVEFLSGLPDTDQTPAWV